MALRDHFQEKSSKGAEGGSQHPATVIDEADVWALEYIK
jgi:hypothetical protein